MNDQAGSVSRKRTQAYLLVGCGLLGVVLVVGLTIAAPRQNGTAGDSTSGSSGSSSTKPASPTDNGGAAKADQDQKNAGKGSGEQNGTKSSGIRPTLYSGYLDQLCPRLTPAEEDKLVADSGGDPKVLIGLVFAGSPRKEQWLRDALLKAPEAPLVHYAILCNGYKGFDRLHSAQELGRLAPDDAAPLYAAANEWLKRGDRENAIACLREAAGRDQFSSFFVPAREAAIEVFQMAGRPENDALARVLVGGISNFEDVTLLDLERGLGLYKSPFPYVVGQEELGALMLGAYQKAAYSPGVDLKSYYGAVGSTVEYLRSFLAAASAADNIETVQQYLPRPVSEMFKQAEAERDGDFGLLLFSQDRPGIYQRLSPGERNELLQRLQQEGELAAYRWVYQTRPDIFRSPDFPFQGAAPDQWKAYIANQYGSSN